MTRDELVAEEVFRLEQVCRNCDIPYRVDSLKSIIIDSLNMKSQISKILNLDEEEGLRREIPCVNQSFFDIWKQYRANVRGEAAEYLNVPYSTIHFNWSCNRLSYGKQKMKIGKFLGKTYDDPGFTELKKFIHEVFNLYNIDTIAQLMARVKADDYFIVISTRPTDILTASYNSAFTSCFRPDGEYANAPMSFALDNFTAIAYITNQNRGYRYKFSRVFVHLNTTIPLFQIGASYGDMFHKDNKLALRQEIISLYDKFFSGNKRWMVTSYTEGLVSVDDDSSPIYIDDGQMIIYDADTISPSELSGYPFRAGSSRCVICGNTTYIKSGWYCNKDDEFGDYFCSNC